MGFSRRDLMSIATATAAAGAIATGASGQTGGRSDGPSLDALAKAKSRTGFGSFLNSFARDPAQNHGIPADFDDIKARDVHLKECGIVTAGVYWTWTRPNAKDFVFYNSDRIIDWAEQQRLKIRGHNLVWLRYDRMPDWLNNYDFGPRPATEAERLLREHITTFCRRYGTRIFTWDVVNEAIDPHTGLVRDDAFHKRLGDAVVDIAFDAARQAAPHASLVYNDYMGWTDTSARHREGVFKLLSRLKSQNIRVDAVGVQGHIGPGLIGDVMGNLSFDASEQAALKTFLDNVIAMGHRLAITEFDVGESGLPPDNHARDEALADITRRYLQFMLAYPQLDYIVTWGLVDHHSWLQTRNMREDGALKRPTLYDPSYEPKLMRQAIADALRSAPPGR
ncbi:MAG TPA: endo-1,4-beta-xylanase [Rhizomicrobium sp.]|jgi:endo-1,4-beta-xylanase